MLIPWLMEVISKLKAETISFTTKVNNCMAAEDVADKDADKNRCEGKNSKRDDDKLAAAKVRLADGKIVNAPILPDCPVNIECTIVDSIMTGSHEMFIGKIEYVHADAKLVDAEGISIFQKLNFCNKRDMIVCTF